ncbi:MAG TPA: PadR family transcriptional regulator [Acidocella sp.]|nr:PadR family transcriptional regulator [Acidocella sp.]
MSKMAVTREAPRSHADLTDRAYWAGSIKMALSKFFILRTLHDGPAHGYDIARAVERITSGCCSPSEGALYPALREFEEGGYVTSRQDTVSGRQRRVYTLTDKGRRAFQVGVSAWMEVTDVLVATQQMATKKSSTPCDC